MEIAKSNWIASGKVNRRKRSLNLALFLILFRIQSEPDGLQSREVKTGDEQQEC
jgi:hypothetical protein